MQAGDHVRDMSIIIRFIIFFLIVCFFIAGCSGIKFHSKDGTNHHLIIGIGMISTKEQQGVTVEDAKVLGLLIGKGSLNAGLGQQHNVEIDPKQAQNVVISIHSTPFSLDVTNFNQYSSSKTQTLKYVISKGP